MNTIQLLLCKGCLKRIEGDEEYCETCVIKFDNAKLRERVAELEVECGNLNGLIEFYKPSFKTAMGVTLGDIIKGIEAIKQLAQRDAEIVELRKDRARLDGMIKHNLVCERAYPSWYRVSKLHEDGYAVERESATSPREAIDAAIEAANT